MPGDQYILFLTLKKQIAAMMRQSYPGINPDISEWRGQEITDFQEELSRKVNAHISEKWFYTHMKSSGNALPRIDVLNLLSRYVGYRNWDDFRYQNSGDEIVASQPVSDQVPIDNRAPASDSTRLALRFLKGEYGFMLLIPLLALVLLGLFIAWYHWFSVRNYTFCFRDADTREIMTETGIDVKLLSPVGENGRLVKTNNGCFSYRTNQSSLRMVVLAPYYLTDTVDLIVTKLEQDIIIDLHADEYAMMIHYFSTMKVAEWQKRRNRLDQLFSDDALICQVFRNHDASGMELFDKKEFIDRLTMPSGNLKNVEVLETRVIDGKIKLLKFRIKR